MKTPAKPAQRVAVAALSMVAVAMLLSDHAGAITLTVDSMELNMTDRAAHQSASPHISSELSDGSGYERQFVMSVLDAGGTAADNPGTTLNATTRYAQEVGVVGNSNSASWPTGSEYFVHANYRVTFTVTSNNPNTKYQVQISNSRHGAALAQDVGYNGAAHITESRAWLNGSNQPLDELGLDEVGKRGFQSGGQLTQFDQTSGIYESGNWHGSRTFTVDFYWRITVDSSGSFPEGGDEAVLLMGLEGINPLFGISDEYPGFSGRTQQLDGHFFNIVVTVPGAAVPEPTGAMLGGMALTALALVVRRRRSTT